MEDFKAALIVVDVTRAHFDYDFNYLPVPEDDCQRVVPVYNIERTIQETGKLFHDRAHIVYVNGAYRGTDEVDVYKRQTFRPAHSYPT